MKKEIPRKRVNHKSLDKKASEEKRCSSEGLSFGDYSPRYQAPYNIYEKAKEHVRDQKKKTLKKDEKRC